MSALPMETAPRDGRPILVWFSEYKEWAIALWREWPDEGFGASYGEWVDQWNSEPFETDDSIAPLIPAYWAPLPNVPE